MLSKITAFALATLVGLFLAGCTSTPGPAIDTACDWVRPILIGKADVLTQPTASEILAHNLKWQRNCPEAAK